MKFNFENKTAIITGGSKGIGFSIAKELSLVGAKIILVSRSKSNLKKAKKEITDLGGNVIKLIENDLSDKKSIDNIKKESLDQGLFPDILINNAGGPPPGTFIDHNYEIWLKSFNQNLMSVVSLTKLFSKNMIQNNWGRIINIASTVAIEPSSEMVLSATFRSAVSAYSKSTSLTLAKRGVTINTISPGGVSTERLHDLLQPIANKNKRSLEEELKEASKSIPMGRFADPDELGCFAVFLCSHYARYLTGQVFPFDGGLVKSF